MLDRGTVEEVMRSATIAAVGLGWLAGLQSCGKSSDSGPREREALVEESSSVPQAEQEEGGFSIADFTSSAKEYATKGYSEAERVADETGTAKYAGDAYDYTKEKLSEISPALLAEWRDLYNGSEEDLRALLNSTGSGIEGGLNSVANDFNLESTASRKAADFALTHTPLLRGVKRYADARVLYASAESSEDMAERDLQQSLARRECLIACFEAGIDVTTLGNGGMGDALGKHADKVLSLLKKTEKLGLLKHIGVLSTAQASQVDVLLAATTQIPSVRMAMDQMLSFDFSTLGDQAFSPR